MRARMHAMTCNVCARAHGAMFLLCYCVMHLSPQFRAAAAQAHGSMDGGRYPAPLCIVRACCYYMYTCGCTHAYGVPCGIDNAAAHPLQVSLDRGQAEKSRCALYSYIRPVIVGMGEYVVGSVLGLSTLREEEDANKAPPKLSEAAKQRQNYLKRYKDDESGYHGDRGKKKKRRKKKTKSSSGLRMVDEDVDWKDAPEDDPEDRALTIADDDVADGKSSEAHKQCSQCDLGSVLTFKVLSACWLFIPCQQLLEVPLGKGVRIFGEVFPTTAGCTLVGAG
jgi:hypothetical protein